MNIVPLNTNGLVTFQCFKGVPNCKGFKHVRCIDAVGYNLIFSVIACCQPSAYIKYKNTSYKDTWWLERKSVVEWIRHYANNPQFPIKSEPKEIFNQMHEICLEQIAGRRLTLEGNQAARDDDPNEVDSSDDCESDEEITPAEVQFQLDQQEIIEYAYTLMDWTGKELPGSADAQLLKKTLANMPNTSANESQFIEGANLTKPFVVFFLPPLSFTQNFFDSDNKLEKAYKQKNVLIVLMVEIGRDMGQILSTLQHCPHFEEDRTIFGEIKKTYTNIGSTHNFVNPKALHRNLENCLKKLTN